MFASAAATVFYLFPREGKFKYEFAKGRFWKHGVLISDFDFPILKTDDQIKNERDSTLKHFKPYFELDSLLHLDELDRFANDFAIGFPEIRKDYLFLKGISFTKNQTLAQQFQQVIEH